MINYDSLITFLESINAESDLIDQFRRAFTNTKDVKSGFELSYSGWHTLEGVMLLKPDAPNSSDYLVFLIATTERSIRELLLKFPRQKVGLFRTFDKWFEDRIQDIIVGESIQIDDKTYFRGVKRGSDKEAEQRTITKRKDEVAIHIRKISSIKGKLEHSEFVVENELLVKRAVHNGQPIDAILYTANFLSGSESQTFLKQATQENISCFLVNDGLMGSVTTTRPVPTIITTVHFNYHNFLTETGELNFQYNRNSNLLIVENVSNPDNLGMIFRTADAAGIDAVLLCGDGASPFHKNTIRASRGAVGRLPMFYTSDTTLAIQKLIKENWDVIGTTPGGNIDLYDIELSDNKAIIVGNETNGLTKETIENCTQLIRVPMASGQSSLNVAVTSGILLYEIVRQKSEFNR